MASHGISRSEYTARSRDEHLRARELKKIIEYSNLNGHVQEKRSSNDYTPDALKLTSQLLRLNPEFYTIWNYRRQILQRTLFVSFTPQLTPTPTPDSPAPGKEQTPEPPKVAHNSTLTQHLKEELQFLLPLLSSYPKCYWIWNHRLWTLHQSTHLLPPSASSRFWQEELGLVGLMLRRDVRNFHGWMYRRFVVSSIEHPTPTEKTPTTSLVEQEFAYTTKMLQGVGGMSNYSAWHNRSKLIPRLLTERGYGEQERMDFLEDELVLLKRNIATNPYDSSVWFYHRWLIYSNTTWERREREAIAPFMTRGVKMLMLGDEIETLKELLVGQGGCKYILKALVGYMGLLHRIRKEPKEEGEDEEEEEVDEENEKEEMRGWLERLVVIDPMRVGRYRDLGRFELPVNA